MDESPLIIVSFKFVVVIYHHYYDISNNVPSEPYTFRSVRIHLARVLDLLRTSGPNDALKEGRSPSVLDTLTNTQITGTQICCALRKKGQC